MKLIKSTLFLTIFLMNNIKAQVVFTTSSISVNIANGTEAVRVNFVVKTDSLILPNNLTYNDISHFQIEKTDGGLNARMVNSINKTDSITSFTFTDTEIGNGTQEYKLLAVNNSNNSIVIGSQIFSKQAINPELNCVKLDKLYRKACHNCFEPQFSPSTFASLDETRVIEFDIHSHETGSFFGNPDQAPKGVWFVRHLSPPFAPENDNNCGSGNKNFNICLNDVQQWHLDPNHNGHDPIIVFLDLKRRGIFGDTGPFWRGNHKPSDLNNVLLHFAIDIGGVDNLYKPSDLKGNFPTTRDAAKNGNWPSLGNLKNKIMFVLTGVNADLNQYIVDLKQNNIDAMAFIAVSPDPFSNPSNGFIPQFIDFSAEQEVAFYNLDDGQLNVAKDFAILQGYMTRSWQGDPTDSQEYGDNIFNKVNNIAIKNLFNNSLNSNMNFQLIDINNITVGGTPSNPELIASAYNHITQHALQTVTTQNLTVLPGTHYNITAGKEIDLLPGTDIQQGANTDIFISNCEDYIATMRVNPFANQEQGRALTQQEINWMLNNAKTTTDTSSIKTATQQLFTVSIYPNPTTGSLTITQLEQFAGGNLEIVNLMGQVVFSQPINATTLTINLAHQPKGIYLIKISSNKENVVQKVVVE